MIRGALLLLFLLPWPAAAARFTVDEVCPNYQLVRRGADLVLTCPWSITYLPELGRFGFASPADRATIKGWYSLCLYHSVTRTMAGATIKCMFPYPKPR